MGKNETAFSRIDGISVVKRERAKYQPVSIRSVSEMGESQGIKITRIVNT